MVSKSLVTETYHWISIHCFPILPFRRGISSMRGLMCREYIQGEVRLSQLEFSPGIVILPDLCRERAGRIEDDKSEFRVVNNFLSLPIKSTFTYRSNCS